MRRFLAILVFIGLSFIAFAQTVEVQHLSERRTLVRTDGGSGVLLLPVQESSPEASIKVLADTDLWQTINVRLATDKVDYFVPLDLGQWKTKSVLLDITSARGHLLERDKVFRFFRTSGSRALPSRIPLRSFFWLDERSKRNGLQGRLVASVLPVQPIRKYLGEHDLGACRLT